MRTKMLNILKKNIGNMNHLYITCRVGLSSISNDTKVDEKLRTSWDPVDYKMSVARSELFLKKSTLIYLFEIVEDYFLTVIKNEYFNISYDPNVDVKSMFAILKFVETNYEVNQAYLDYVYIMRIFRNYLVHGSYKITERDNSELRSVKNKIIKSKDFYYKNFNNLDVIRTLDKIEQIINGVEDVNPSFKEVTTCNSIAFLLADEFEQELFKTMDVEATIHKYISENIIGKINKISNYIKQGNKTRAINFLKSNIRHNLIHLNDDQLNEIIQKSINYYYDTNSGF